MGVRAFNASLEPSVTCATRLPVVVGVGLDEIRREDRLGHPAKGIVGEVGCVIVRVRDREQVVLDMLAYSLGRWSTLTIKLIPSASGMSRYANESLWSLGPQTSILRFRTAASDGILVHPLGCCT